MLRMIWRSSSEDPIQDYWLKTVTYGTASAPYRMSCAARACQRRSELSSSLILTRTYFHDIN
ncbi:unnamed protein product, partial [Nesidiocoris tenuis]